ncbi:MAG: TetR/AcrR family transcriptional regulator, partial [Deltaproteobacteria bacterium]|nr:TetR/AcrR family transcriptional regulator [Kofleriaceae bacterium]
HIVGSPAGAGPSPPRERLLIAAEAVWSDVGYAASRVEDVLKVADVSRATFYQHFRGKEELAAALLDRAIEVLLEAAARRSLGGTTYEEKVAAALDAYLELWERHGRIVSELTVEALRPGSSLGPVRKRAVDAAVAVLSAQFQLQRGVPIEPMVVRHLILGIEAVLMHERLERRARPAQRDQLLAIALAAANGPELTRRASAPSARPARRASPGRRARR